MGLTGGIACGKSHVLRRLAARGCQTLDLDAVAREVTAPGSAALFEIAEAFGAGVLDARGALDRAALGALVFADAEARSRLNRIVHPRVRAAEARWASGFRARADAVLVTDGALLIESGLHLRFDRLVVVHCSPELQLARLRERDGLDEAAARARIEAQLPSFEKRGFAHFEVDSSGSVAETERATDAVAAALAGLAAASSSGPEPPIDAFVGGLVHGPGDGPRGLSPRVVLAQARSAGGLEMEALGRLMHPPAERPWYRAAEAVAPERPASRLGVALAAWAALRRGFDADFLAQAAGSVARLTHVAGDARADACLVALVALERAGPTAGAAGPGACAVRWRELASRFGGAAPSGRLEAVWSALEQSPRDPAQAAALSARAGGDGPTAAALAGLLSGPAGPAVEDWRSVLAALRPAD